MPKTMRVGQLSTLQQFGAGPRRGTRLPGAKGSERTGRPLVREDIHNKDGAPLPTGLQGTVTHEYQFGACINFDSLKQQHWVLEEDFGKLRVETA